MKWILAIASLLVGFAAGIWSREERAASTAPPTPTPTNSASGAGESLPDPIAEILTTLGRKPGLRQFAALGKPLARLTPEQVSRLMRELSRDPRDVGNDRAQWLFRWWLEHDPEAASAWMAPRLQRVGQDGPLGGDSISPEGEMVKLWAKAFPERALELAHANPRSGTTAALLTEVLGRREKSPPSQTWAVLRDFPDCPGRAKVVAQFISKWSEQDAGAAFAAALALAPGQTRDDALVAALPKLAEQNAAAAFTHYEELGLSDSELLGKMVSGAAAKDPAAIAAWLVQLDRGQFGQTAPGLVEKWAAQDPAAAFAWAAEHQVRLNVKRESMPELTYTGTAIAYTSKTGPAPNAYSAAMKAKPAETLAWVNSLPDGDDRARMAAGLLPFAEAGQAIQLFDLLPPDERSSAAYNLGKILAADPPRAAAWAGALPAGSARETAWMSIGSSAKSAIDVPPGADRDAWLTGRLHSSEIYSSGPIAALDLIPQIGDSAKRQRAFDRTMEEKLRDAPAPEQKEKIFQWLEKSSLPAEWKTKWQKK
jgi:hypothetical protein